MEWDICFKSNGISSFLDNESSEMLLFGDIFILSMKNKNLLNECKCIHCQQKLDQIKNSRLYWSKLTLSKTLN